MTPTEYAWELCSAYWPGLPREDFDEYIAVGVDAAQLLEVEWQDVVLAEGPALDWHDLTAPALCNPDLIAEFYDHSFGMTFELLRGIGTPTEMGEGDHRGNIVHIGMTAHGGHGPILDYGGGIGQQALFLGRLGHQVAFADCGETALFAQWRFDREGDSLDAGTILSLSPEAALQKPPVPWGAICALDVVEHVPDPLALLKKFDACLAPDGILFMTHDSFKDFPTHLPESAPLQGGGIDAVMASLEYDRIIAPDSHFGIGGWRKTGAAPA